MISYLTKNYLPCEPVNFSQARNLSVARAHIYIYIYLFIFLSPSIFYFVFANTSVIIFFGLYYLFDSCFIQKKLHMQVNFPNAFLQLKKLEVQIKTFIYIYN